MLAQRGAVVLDADAIVHELYEPGSPVLKEVADRFGPDMLRSDGTLDRAKLAEIVFANEEARKSLNAIVHPKVFERMVSRLQHVSGSDVIVVLDVPLLFESEGGSGGLVSEVVVVRSTEEKAIERLSQRGVPPDDARARMRAQSPLGEKVARADHVLDNDGTVEDLERQVDDLWLKLTAKS